MQTVNPASVEKPYLRDFFREKRTELLQNTERKSALDTEIQTRLIISREYRESKTILVYMARPSEIATSMIIHAALANLKTVGMPVCIDDGRMIFRRIHSVRELVPGSYGILEPPETCAEIIPDARTLCVCPALCCDLDGYRLGYGGGYYDRWLAEHPVKKAALCYSDSVIPAISHDDYDVRMDVIHTDSFSRTIV